MFPRADDSLSLIKISDCKNRREVNFYIHVEAADPENAESGGRDTWQLYSRFFFLFFWDGPLGRPLNLPMRIGDNSTR